jgi:hypothetical protein
VGTPITESPAAHTDIFTGNFEIYYNDAGNLTEDAFVTSSRTWTGPRVLASGITGRPSVAGFPFAGQLQLHYNHGGQLYQDVLVPHVGFTGPRAVGSSIIGSPAAIPIMDSGLSNPIIPPSGCMNIFYQDTDPSRGNVPDLSEDSWCQDQGSPALWSGAVDLTTNVTGLTGSAVPIALGPSGPISDTFTDIFPDPPYPPEKFVYQTDKVYFQMGNNLVCWPAPSCK